jgi:hypothetical protein
VGRESVVLKHLAFFGWEHTLCGDLVVVATDTFITQSRSEFARAGPKLLFQTVVCKPLIDSAHTQNARLLGHASLGDH